MQTLYIDPVAWDALGWTMVHFFWIGGLVGLFVAAGRAGLRRSTAGARYTFLLVCLAALAVAPPVIFSGLLVLGVPRAHLAEGPRTDGPSGLEGSTIVGEPPPVAVHGGRVSSASPSATFRRTPAPSGDSPMVRFLPSLVRRLPWIWLFGGVLSLFVLFVGHRGVLRLRRASRPLDRPQAILMCRRLESSLGLARRVVIEVCDRIASPVVVGVLRPAILLPPSAILGCSPGDLELILLHELAHVRRHDNLVNLFQRVVEALLFFHPAVWWISRCLRTEREIACDELVIARTGAPRRYARLLARFALADGMWPEGSISMGGVGVARRIRRVLYADRHDLRVSWPPLLYMTGTILLPLVVLVCFGTMLESRAVTVSSFLRFSGEPGRAASLQTACVAYDGPGDARVLLVAGFPYGERAYWEIIRRRLSEGGRVLHDRRPVGGGEPGAAGALVRRLFAAGRGIEDQLWATVLGLESEERAIDRSTARFTTVAPEPGAVKTTGAGGSDDVLRFQRLAESLVGNVEPLLTAIAHDVGLFSRYIRGRATEDDPHERPRDEIGAAGGPSPEVGIEIGLERLLAREIVRLWDIEWTPPGGPGREGVVKAAGGKSVLEVRGFLDPLATAMAQRARDLVEAGTDRVTIYTHPGRMAHVEAALVASGAFRSAGKEWLTAWNLSGTRTRSEPGAGEADSRRARSRSALRVLYLEGTARWEYRYLKNLLLREPYLIARVFLLGADPALALESRPGLSRPGAPPRTREEMSEYDVIIIGDVPAVALLNGEPSLERLIAEQVRDHGAGLVAVAGAGFAVESGLAEILPVRFGGERRELQFSSPRALRLTEDGERSPILSLASDPETNRRLWEETLPGLHAVRSDVQVRPGAVVLAVVPPPVPGEEPDPLWVAGGSGRGRVVVSATDGTWRWRAVEDGDSHHERFWTQLVRWAAASRK